MKLCFFTTYLPHCVGPLLPEAVPGVSSFSTHISLWKRKVNNVKSFSFRYFTLLFRSNHSLMISCCGCPPGIAFALLALQVCTRSCTLQLQHIVAGAGLVATEGCICTSATSASLFAIGAAVRSTTGTTRKEFRTLCMFWWWSWGTTTVLPACSHFPNEFSSLLIQSFSVLEPQTLLVRRLFHHWMHFAVRI